MVRPEVLRVNTGRQILGRSIDIEPETLRKPRALARSPVTRRAMASDSTKKQLMAEQHNDPRNIFYPQDCGHYSYNLFQNYPLDRQHRIAYSRS